MTLLDTPLAELDTSPRAASYLAESGVATLGELLALPSLHASPRVLEELHSLFDELEVSYEGEFVLEATEPVRVATGTVAERWASIRAWLQLEHPARLAEWQPGATLAAVRAVEAAVGATFPTEYTEFVQLQDGQEPGAPMLESAALLPLEEVARRHRILADLFPQKASIARDEVDAEVRAVEFSDAWIPIGVSARGRDVLCIDLDPTPEGQRGQIILVVLDDDVRSRVATGFAELLSRYFEEAQTGEVDLDEE